MSPHVSAQCRNGSIFTQRTQFLVSTRERNFLRGETKGKPNYHMHPRELNIGNSLCGHHDFFFFFRLKMDQSFAFILRENCRFFTKKDKPHDFYIGHLILFSEIWALAGSNDWLHSWLSLKNYFDFLGVLYRLWFGYTIQTSPWYLCDQVRFGFQTKTAVKHKHRNQILIFGWEEANSHLCH